MERLPITPEGKDGSATISGDMRTTVWVEVTNVEGWAVLRRGRGPSLLVPRPCPTTAPQLPGPMPDLAGRATAAPAPWAFRLPQQRSLLCPAALWSLAPQQCQVHHSMLTQSVCSRQGCAQPSCSPSAQCQVSEHSQSSGAFAPMLSTHTL